MGRFIYRAKEKDTCELMEGTLEADSIEQVVDYLKTRNCVVMDITSSGFNLPWLKHSLDSASKRLSTKDIILLCEELAVIIEAGVAVVEAFKLLEAYSSKPQVHKFLKVSLQQLQEGQSLAWTWQQQGQMPTYVINALVVAEQTGLLAKGLRDSAEYLTKVALQREKLWQMAIYPLMLTLMLILVAGLMIYKIIPTFESVFTEMDIPLPGLTRILFVISDLANTYWWSLPLVMLLLVGSTIYGSKQESFKEKLYLGVFNLPKLGAKLEALWLVDFSNQLLLLYGSGIPLEEAFKIMLEEKSNALWCRRLEKIRRSLQQGQSLHNACQYAGISHEVFLQLLKVGEETGGLGHTLNYGNKFLTKEVDRFLARSTALLEPLLIMVVGILVGIFVFALIVPLFDIPNNISM